MARPSKKDLVLDAAERLFYENGIHATGVDAVIAEAGVARMTLYNHFPTKDALVAAMVERRDARFRRWLSERLEGVAAPDGKLLACFDALDDWFRGKAEPPFLGCAFVRAAGEYTEGPVFEAAAAHKKALLASWQALAEDAGAREPQRLAHKLFLLAEGAITSAYVLKDPGAAVVAKEAAATLIAEAVS